MGQSNAVTHFTMEDMKTRVIEAARQEFFRLIPDEVLDQMVSKEIESFFKTDDWVRVDKIKEEIPNPNYNPNLYSNSYENRKTLEREFNALSVRMSPFKQLVWKSINEMLLSRTIEILDKHSKDENTKLGDWIMNEFDRMLKEGMSAQLTTMILTNVIDQTKGVMAMNTTSFRDTLRQTLVNNGIHPHPIIS